jgi:hypothetical protein
LCQIFRRSISSQESLHSLNTTVLACPVPCPSFSICSPSHLPPCSRKSSSFPSSLHPPLCLPWFCRTTARSWHARPPRTTLWIMSRICSIMTGTWLSIAKTSIIRRSSLRAVIPSTKETLSTPVRPSVTLIHRTAIATATMTIRAQTAAHGPLQLRRPRQLRPLQTPGTRRTP